MSGEWRDSAACAGVDTALFFPDGGQHSGAHGKAICARCPVKADCLDYAMSQPGEHVWGIWGGTTAADRREMRRAS